MDHTARELVQQAANILQSRPYTVALAGAGMSKESGIPTFRGSGGLWTENGEPPLDQYQQFQRDPKRWWEDRSNNSLGDFAQKIDSAQPNPGHFALAKMEEMGILRHLITQNIDDLHRRAGHQSLTEIHGNRNWMRCVSCGFRISQRDFTYDPNVLPVYCDEDGCDGIIKSDTVMFGEPIPPQALNSSSMHSDLSDVFLTIGTSALVYPAAAFPVEAIQRGKILIEINPEPTQLTEHATIAIGAESGQVLPLLVEMISELDE